MKLEVHERIALLQILPTSGDYAALKTIRRAKEMISFTPEEVEFYEIKQIGEQATWNSRKASEVIKDIPVDEYTTNLIRNKLVEMDRKKQLTENHLSLYEKFVVIYQ